MMRFCVRAWSTFVSTCRWELLSWETDINRNSEDTIMWHPPVIWNFWVLWKNFYQPERAMLTDKSRGIKMDVIRSHKLKPKSLLCRNNSKILNLSFRLPQLKIKSSLLTFKKIKSKLMPKEPFVRVKKSNVTSKEIKLISWGLIVRLISIESYPCSIKQQLHLIKSHKMIWHN